MLRIRHSKSGYEEVVTTEQWDSMKNHPLNQFKVVEVLEKETPKSVKDEIAKKGDVKDNAPA